MWWGVGMSSRMSIVRGLLIVSTLVGGVHVCAPVLCSRSRLCRTLVLTWGADGCNGQTCLAWLSEHLQGGLGSVGGGAAHRVRGPAALRIGSVFS